MPAAQGAAPLALAVVVRTLGRAHLGDALDSLVAQTRQDFETVVVDMSGGRAAPVVGRRAPRLRRVRHLVLPGPLGRSDALNVGIRQSTADAIAILDDDNLFTPGHVATLLDGLATTGADLVYSAITRQTLSPGGAPLREDIKQTSFDADRLLFGNFIYATGTAFRRAIWARVGGYDPRFPVYEDWEFLIRVAGAGTIAALDAVSGVSRNFTGDPAGASHLDDRDACAACVAGLRWVHRARYTAALFERRPDLVRDHPDVPIGGVGPGHEPWLAHWRASSPTHP